MGAMKDFDRRIRQGGDDAIAAVEEYVAEQERLVAQVESMLQRACDRHWKEWIPVEERLPEEGVVVLAYLPKQADVESGVYAAMLSKLQTLKGTFSTSFGFGFEATHWMPLPEPPEVK